MDSDIKLGASESDKHLCFRGSELVLTLWRLMWAAGSLNFLVLIGGRERVTCCGVREDSDKRLLARSGRSWLTLETFLERKE